METIAQMEPDAWSWGWREINCSLLKYCCSLWAAAKHVRLNSDCNFQQLADLGMLRATPSVTEMSDNAVCLVDRMSTIHQCSAQLPHSFTPS